MSKNVNQYDLMKKMLNITRSYRYPINEGSIPNLQPQEYDDEKEKFSQAVTTIVEFGYWTPFKGGIEWGGYLVKEKIKWIFSTSDTGCFISCDNIVLTDDVVKVIQNLKGYYDVWSKYWGEQLNSTV